MIRQRLHTIPRPDLHTVHGWNAALAAVTSGPGPHWRRGDGAIPIPLGGDGGVLLGHADTWVRNVTDAVVRNTLVHVRQNGRVDWIRPANPHTPAITTGGEPGTWWWPTGGVPLTTTTAAMFGGAWETGGVYGTRTGWAYSVISGLDEDEPAAGALVDLDLDTAWTWGAPCVFDGAVHTIGYRAVAGPSWEHVHATCTLASLAAGAPDWTVSADMTMTDPLSLGASRPLTTMRLVPLLGGHWLATAMVLPSGPELDYDSSGEIAAWVAEDPAGPWTRIADLATGVGRPWARQYAAGACYLPGIEVPVGEYNENHLADEPGAAWDGYGPRFIAVRTIEASEFPA